MGGLADSLVARMVAQRDLLRDIDDRFASIAAQVTSTDGSLRVEVDALGTLTGLNLTAGALELHPDALQR